MLAGLESMGMCRTQFRGLEDGFMVLHVEPHLREKLTQNGIVDDADAVRQDFDRVMHIPDRPPDLRGLRLAGYSTNFNHGLGSLANDIQHTVLLVECIVVAERFVEIESEIRSVGSRSAPAGLGERMAVRDDFHATRVRRRVNQLFVNGDHVSSEEEVSLGHWKRTGRLTGQHHPVRLDRIGLRIDFDVRKRVVPNHIGLPDLARVDDG